MTLMVVFRALAGQTPLRIIAKAGISLLVVLLAILFSRGGSALAIIIIFTGVTGPTIRLVTMKLDGTFDRIIVSPVSKPWLFLTFAALWVIAVIIPLLPAITVVALFQGPVSIIPVVTGTILAVTLGTIAGFLAHALSDAHLAALFLAGLLIPLSLFRTPAAVLLPFTALSYPPAEPAGLLLSAILPLAGIVILVVVTSRS
jgi:hypothetical protein